MSASKGTASHQTERSETASNRAPTAADLDFPTFGRLVEQEARDLLERAQAVNDGVIGLTADHAWASNAEVGSSRDSQSSAEPVAAAINEIGVRAFQLSRHVRTLADFRDADLAVRAAIEAGI